MAQVAEFMKTIVLKKRRRRVVRKATELRIHLNTDLEKE
jgi:hypothetical protein